MENKAAQYGETSQRHRKVYVYPNDNRIIEIKLPLVWYKVPSTARVAMYAILLHTLYEASFNQVLKNKYHGPRWIVHNANIAIQLLIPLLDC